MSNNVNEKLKESFKSGTEAKAGLRKASSSATTIAYWVFGVLFALITVFSFIPSLFGDDEATAVSKSSGIKRTERGEVTRYTIQAKVDTWSVPIGVPKGTCFVAWTERFGPAEIVQIATERPMKEEDWVDVKTGAHSEKLASWVRVASHGPGPAEVILEIRPNGRCSSRRS